MIIIKSAGSSALLSSYKAFAWMGKGIGVGVDALVKNWLTATAKELRDRSARLCRKKDLYIQYFVAGSDARVYAIGEASTEFPFRLQDWAFDTTFVVPPGGFAPPAGQRAWRMKKPEGLVWRSKIYNKRGGETIKRIGFFSEAMRETFTGPQLDKLGQPLAVVVGTQIASRLRAALTARGYTVV